MQTLDCFYCTGSKLTVSLMSPISCKEGLLLIRIFGLTPENATRQVLGLTNKSAKFVLIRSTSVMTSLPDARS